MPRAPSRCAPRQQQPSRSTWNATKRRVNRTDVRPMFRQHFQWHSAWVDSALLVVLGLVDRWDGCRRKFGRFKAPCPSRRRASSWSCGACCGVGKWERLCGGVVFRRRRTRCCRCLPTEPRAGTHFTGSTAGFLFAFPIGGLGGRLVCGTGDPHALRRLCPAPSPGAIGHCWAWVGCTNAASFPVEVSLVDTLLDLMPAVACEGGTWHLGRRVRGSRPDGHRHKTPPLRVRTEALLPWRTKSQP